MYCMGCGQKLPEGAGQCPECGRAVPKIEDPAVPNQASMAEPPAPATTRCSKCGAENLADNQYCQSCGAVMRQAHRRLTEEERDKLFGGAKKTVGEIAGKASASDFRTKWIALSIVQLVVACMGLLPVLVINVPFIGGSYSLLDMLRILGLLQSYAPSGSSSGLGVAMVLIIALICVWLAALIVGIVNIVRSTKEERFLSSGFVLLAVLGCACLLAAFLLSSSLTSATSSYGISTGGVVSASAWVWIMLIASIIGAVVSGYLRETQRKA